MTPALPKIDRPWLFLRYLLADRRAALFAASNAPDPATFADAVVRANEATRVLRIGFGVPS